MPGVLLWDTTKLLSKFSSGPLQVQKLLIDVLKPIWHYPITLPKSSSQSNEPLLAVNWKNSLVILEQCKSIF